MNTEIILIEGFDGAGKDTIINGLYNYLKSKNYSILLTREPGGSEVAEKIREVILDPTLEEMEPETEAMLYASARYEHVIKKVFPNIGKYDFIIMSRYVPSSIAYQGYGRKLGTDYIINLNSKSLDLLRPNIGIYLNISFEESRKRVSQRGKKDRLEKADIDFYNRTIRGYNEQDDLIHVDASKCVEEVLEDTINVIIKESEVLV